MRERATTTTTTTMRDTHGCERHVLCASHGLEGGRTQLEHGRDGDELLVPVLGLGVGEAASEDKGEQRPADAELATCQRLARRGRRRGGRRRPTKTWGRVLGGSSRVRKDETPSARATCARKDGKAAWRRTSTEAKDSLRPRTEDRPGENIGRSGDRRDGAEPCLLFHSGTVTGPGQRPEPGHVLLRLLPAPAPDTRRPRVPGAHPRRPADLQRPAHGPSRRRRSRCLLLVVPRTVVVLCCPPTTPCNKADDVDGHPDIQADQGAPSGRRAQRPIVAARPQRRQRRPRHPPR